MMEPQKPMFVALSRFSVANGMAAAIHEAFRQRPHLAEQAPGFLRMDVISPRDRPEDIWLQTYWTDAESYRHWHRSHQYHESNRSIPKGLKLVPGSVSIEFFDHMAQ